MLNAAWPLGATVSPAEGLACPRRMEKGCYRPLDRLTLAFRPKTVWPSAVTPFSFVANKLWAFGKSGRHAGIHTQVAES